MDDKINYDNFGYLIKHSFFDINSINVIYQEVLNDHAVIVKRLNNLLVSKLISDKDIAIEDGNIKYLKNPQIYFKSINRLVSSKLVDLAEKLIGENVFIDVIELHQKYPGASATPPHQDNFYFCLENGKSLTAYIPLNDQSFENGALAVIPKSHLLDLDHHPSSVPGFSSGITLTDNQKNNLDNYILRTGDLSIHHCNIVHLAPPNLSTVPRINIAVRLRSLTDKVDKKRLEKYKKFRDNSVRIV